MNAISLSNVFSALLTRYRREITDLDHAEDEREVDRLTTVSQETLTQLVETRPRTAAAMADKIDALIRRYEDFGVMPLAHVLQLLLDAHHLATEPGTVMAWVSQWHDLGGSLIVQPDGTKIIGLPEPLRIGDAYTDQLPANLRLYSQEEALGAAKALQAMLKLAGQRMIDGVFAFARVAKEG